MLYNREQLILCYPTAPEKEIKSAIKYQEKFSLTLDNLKCLNPECNNIRKWDNGGTRFNYCCSVFCKKIMKNKIDLLKNIKSKKTYLSKYGFEHSGLDPKVQKLRKETYFKRTGYEFNSQNPEVKQKKKDTYKNKTGFENPFQNPEVKQKTKETCFKQTGYIHHKQNPESIQKSKKICLKKYGTSSNSNKHITNFENWNNKQFWLDNFIMMNNNFDYIKCTNFFNCNQVAAHNQIKRLGIEYTRIGGISLKEQTLHPLLHDLDIPFMTNTRSQIGLELDIYLPDLNLAIEYNGSYWHSYHETLGTSPKQLDYNYMKYRHQLKSIACYKAGIRLLHIYEYDDLTLDKLENFLFYDQEINTGLEYDLDTGCYPIGIEYEIIEPESRIILKDRTIWNAGKIKLKEKHGRN